MSGGWAQLLDEPHGYDIYCCSAAAYVVARTTPPLTNSCRPTLPLRSLESRLFDGPQSGVGIARLERIERALLRDAPASTSAAAAAAAGRSAGRDGSRGSRSLRSGPSSASSFAQRVAAVEAAASQLHYGIFEVHKGLQNRHGANNCFLNAALQALWHSKVRRSLSISPSAHMWECMKKKGIKMHTLCYVLVRS